MTTPPSRPRGIVLFGPGAGGGPGRYTTLTGALRDAGRDLLAPRAERFAPGTVTPGQLRTRVGLLHDALAAHPDRDTLPVVAAGHSIPARGRDGAGRGARRGVGHGDATVADGAAPRRARAGDGHRARGFLATP
ncbi:hypothetical protein [Pseudonocardia alni]|uniref:hypothetical protein n=1 Tax=Pseudonocardia alni TaxID=33907 RepID=UPI001AD6B4C7|nr:hypothetical protein [Pseudonocardia alni]MBO4236465.1 hypothetical protein [Pseudonocardia alni]